MFVPIPALNFNRCSKLRNPFPLSSIGNKRGRWAQDISRRLAGTQHLPASFLLIFMNLQLNWQSEGGQAFFELAKTWFKNSSEKKRVLAATKREIMNSGKRKGGQGLERFLKKT
ncbi:MAG: hypothetical protein ABH969_12260 [Pseudomonadota bacterium]